MSDDEFLEMGEQNDMLMAELDCANQRIAELEALINHPRFDDFIEAVRIEQAHQVEKWGPDHDKQKRVNDWIAVFARLLGKLVNAGWEHDWQKFEHHLITLAAVAFNCFRRMKEAQDGDADRS